METNASSFSASAPVSASSSSSAGGSRVSMSPFASTLNSVVSIKLDRYVFSTTPQPPRSVEKTDENGVKVLTPQPPPSQSTNGDSSTKAALFASPETVADPAWYADSGATYHITTDFNNLTLQNDYHGSDKFMVANGVLIPITHTGSTSLSSHHHLRTVNLHNVLCVPNIKKSLISISKLTVDNDVFVEFHVNNYLIKDETTS
ncbi:hypothetical protein CsatB_012642 [Cannabis sativa]